MKSKTPIPMSPDELHENEQTFIFMTGESLIEELDQLIEALPKAHGPVGQSMTWRDWIGPSVDIQNLLSVYKPRVLDAALLEMLEAHPLCRTGALSNRLFQMRAVVLGQLHPLPEQVWGPPKAFAVAPAWNRRIGNLIAGALYPAWVGFASPDQEGS